MCVCVCVCVCVYAQDTPTNRFIQGYVGAVSAAVGIAVSYVRAVTSGVMPWPLGSCHGL